MKIPFLKKQTLRNLTFCGLIRNGSDIIANVVCVQVSRVYVGGVKGTRLNLCCA